MTEQDWIDLGKRATACKGWRWRPGMKILVGLNDYDDFGALCVIGANKDGAPLTRDGYGRVTVWQHGPSPDLRDPATLGCLLALVREAYKLPYLSPKMTTSIWRIEDEGAPMKWLIPELECANRSGTEAAALVAALEAAPEPETADD